MKQEPHILLIEDEPDMALLIQEILSQEGYQVTLAMDGFSGLQMAEKMSFQLIILDRVLPQINGLEICRRIRQCSQIPILMLTGKSEISDRVEGLDAGANDYLTKPFHPEELLARVRSQLRVPFGGTSSHILSFADLHLDMDSREVSRGSQAIQLSRKEFDLLLFFMRHPRQVLSKSRLLEEVWGWEVEVNGNTVEVSISHLRKKLNPAKSSNLIHTVHGVGYTLKESSK